MSLQKTIQAEKIALSSKEPSHTIIIGKNQQYFNIITSAIFTSPLVIMLVAKDKVSCIPFFASDRDSCYELGQAEKIVITLGELELPGTLNLTINIW